ETRELVFQQLGFEPNAITCALYDGVAGSGLAAHKQGYTEHTFVPYDGDFRRRAVLHDIQQGNDGRRGKIDVSQAGTGFVQNLTQLHTDHFQMGPQPLEVAGW